LVQAVAALQVPLAVHVSTPLPEHVVWPGEHCPVQAPAMHVWLLQATAELHCPAALHVWTPLPEHCVVPGTHAP
jgi:hypothetical protein